MNRILLNGVVIIMAGLFLAATAWNFSAVASMPEKYVRVDRNRADHERIERKLGYYYRYPNRGRERPMRGIEITPYEMASRFKGIKEIEGAEHNAQILAILQRAQSWVRRDEVAWCSAFIGYVCFLLGLPETKHLRARSWLRIGRPVSTEEAEQGFDVCVFNRANGPQDPTIINAPGHVGFLHSIRPHGIYVLGGNQSNSVNIVRISAKRLLGIRRLGNE